MIINVKYPWNEQDWDGQSPPTLRTQKGENTNFKMQYLHQFVIVNSFCTQIHVF